MPEAMSVDHLTDSDASLVGKLMHEFLENVTAMLEVDELVK
jgi:hypothetical protein